MVAAGNTMSGMVYPPSPRAPAQAAHTRFLRGLCTNLCPHSRAVANSRNCIVYPRAAVA